jgi:hypothetical protein
MKALSLALAAIILCSPSARAETSDKACFVCVLNGLGGYVSSLLKMGPELFAKLGEMQSKQALADVDKGAGDLWAEKDQLSRELKAGEVTKQDFRRSISQILEDVEKWEQQSLARFAEEIAKASNHTSSDLQNQIRSHVNAKMEDLRAIGRLDTEQQGQRDEAIRLLASSMDELTRVQHGTKCLLDSIDKKALACDPSTFEPISARASN